VPLREITHVRAVRALRMAHIVALGVAAVLLLSSATTTLDEDRRTIAQRPTLAKIQAAAERHPLAYYSYAKAAELLEDGKDPRAIRMLNHAMLLHPTHPGLHRMAAHLLLRGGYVSQAAIEYAAALRTTADPAKLVAEIVDKLSPEQAAAAFPIDYPELESLTRTLNELGHSDVATMWLARVLDRRPNQSRACEQLFQIVAQKGDLAAVQIASKRCPDMLPDFQTRIAIAKLLADKHGYAEVLQLLRDVESWEARVDDKINAWLAVCDAHAGLGHVDDAKRCLRRLDASPDMRGERRNELITRLEALQKPTEPAAAGSAATGSAAPSP
jgi:Tfp pilus assembly protein PilF